MCTDHHGNNSVDKDDSHVHQLYNIQSIKNFVITQYTTVAQLVNNKGDCGAVKSASTDEHVMNLVSIQWVESDDHVA